MLTSSDRVLVLGASGWFGRTALSLLPDNVQTLAVSGSTPGFASWSEQDIANFAPTVVMNFAFLTRERVAVEGGERFIDINQELTKRFLWALDQSTVRLGVTVSSGAATDPTAVNLDLNPYGFLKLHEEEQALSRATSQRSIVIARAYSVSGPYVRRPREYGISDFVLQAREGHVHVQAECPVYRRYVSVSDLIQVAVGRGAAGWTGVIESGGELVEMGELADYVVRVVNPTASIHRTEITSSEPSVYASDDVTWQEACAVLGYRPMTLDEQIAAIDDGLPAGN
jgi:nucleoside-diphosphate-sugar epimerase